jgi:hypothetical protein
MSKTRFAHRRYLKTQMGFILTNQYIVLNYPRGQGSALGHLERSLEFASEAQRQSLAFRREFFLELLFTQRDNGSVTRSN